MKTELTRADLADRLSKLMELPELIRTDTVDDILSTLEKFVPTPEDCQVALEEALDEMDDEVDLTDPSNMIELMTSVLAIGFRMAREMIQSNYPFTEDAQADTEN